MQSVSAIDFEAIGTLWTIEIFEPISDIATAKLRQTIDNRVESFDRTYSRFRDDSLVTTMSRAAGRYELPADAKPLLDLYASLYKATDGAMTPLIGQTLADAGYNAHYSLKPGDVKSPPSWNDSLNYHFPHLELYQPTLLDFGAAGKGYLVDIVADILTGHAIDNFCVNAGGDMVYRTSTEHDLSVALEHPADPTQAIGIAHIKNQALCGSSGNRRDWGDYHHIIDPHSRMSPRHIQALWVVAADGLLADGLATALFFTPPESLGQSFNFEYAIVHQDYTLSHSAGFPADFFQPPATPTKPVRYAT